MLVQNATAVPPRPYGTQVVPHRQYIHVRDLPRDLWHLADKSCRVDITLAGDPLPDVLRQFAVEDLLPLWRDWIRA